MPVIRALSEQRRRHIAAQADPYLQDGEEIRHWVRVRREQGRGEGFSFVTETKWIVAWTGRRDGHKSLSWQDIAAWGVDESSVGEPLLAVESTDGEVLRVRLPVQTTGAAERVSQFLRDFSEHAPPTPRTPAGYPSAVTPEEAFDVRVTRRSVAGHTRRILVTILGILLVVGGLAITWIPGPWSLPIVLAGLAVLSSEYDWAKDLRSWAREKYEKTRDRWRARRAQS